MDFNQRQNVINSIGGNTFAWVRDRQLEENTYLCSCCRCFIKESKWDSDNMLCVDCLKEEE